MHISIKFHLTVHNIALTMILPKNNMGNTGIKKFSTIYPQLNYGVNSPKYLFDFFWLKRREKAN